ncbi:cysteine hydrolase family protein [Virgibacillus senegalensis]|uniref:cysteine hydrolase family protein n=1 Tax=Virgibacillus senegalensis TaxID=1499679 RepID=UPI00069DA425|nr:cysteine hydrolase family protein [Virgibacillus senegalensis]
MKSAILIIDVQTGMFTMEPPVHEGNKLLQNLKRLINFGRENHLPVIFVKHNGPKGSPLEPGTSGWSIHKEITPESNDYVLVKETPDCFYKTNLADHLNQLQVDHLIVAGIQTEACVDTTCRVAFHKQYNITLAADGHSTFEKKELTAQQIIKHHNQVLKWFAEVTPVSEIMEG